MKLLRKIESILYTSGTVFIFIMLIVGASDVLGRYIFNHPIPGAVEVEKLMMMMTVIFGWAYVQFTQQHIKVDVLVSHFRPQVKRWLSLAILLLTLAIFILIAWRSTVIGIIYLHDKARWETLNFYLGSAMFAVTFGASLTCIEVITQLVDWFKHKEVKIV